MTSLELNPVFHTANVCIDSRKMMAGQVFVALKGERFDGEEFVLDAVKKGATGIVCHQFYPNISIPQWVVPDTTNALAAMATRHRQSLDCSIIALTGSNGKTTVKEMIASMLPSPSFATPGNLNNHIGVPLSLFQLTAKHRHAVFELGANHLGDIAHTVSMVRPHVALINNIAPAHIEGFGSIDGVARAKGEIYQGLMAGGTAVVNQDDAYAHFWDALLETKTVIRFSRQKPAPIHACDVELDENGCARFTLVTPLGEQPIQLKVPGLHQVSNALAAAACAYAVGLQQAAIHKGLSGFTGVPGRMTFLRGLQQACIINDAYNANLRSVLTALDVLAAREGVRILVLGDMGELGDWSEAHHQEVGLYARSKGIDALMTCGTYAAQASVAFGSAARHYETKAALARDLSAMLDANTTVLVKGSRFSAMEEVAEALLNVEPLKAN